MYIGLNKYGTRINQRTKKIQLFKHNYVNLYITVHATDTILFSSLCPMITKAHVKFQLSPISSFREKVEQTKRQTCIENYGIDIE